MSSRIAGICYIKVDGEQLSVEGSVEVPMSDVTRETLLSTNGVAGYSEMPVIPYVPLNARITDKTSIKKLVENTGMTVTAELANGKVYTLEEAYLAGDLAFNASDGTCTLRFEGKSGSFQE